MTAIHKKIIRDVWRERARSFAVVLAISVGIAGFTSVLSAYSILTRELSKGFLATNPPSATLHIDSIDPESLGAVRSSGLVAAAETRRVVTGHIKTGPIDWRTISLFVVQDFSRINIAKFQPRQGVWPPKIGEMLVERSALRVANAKIGDVVMIQIPNHKEQYVRVVGTVYDAGLAQARMENTVYGYIGSDTLAQLGEERESDALNIVVNGDRFDEQHIRTVADQVKLLLERHGHPVQRIDLPPPGKHPHADLMGLLLLSMSVFGFGLLVMSGILVVNLLAALMAAHVREIGTIKALGANQWQIATMYFGQVVLLGLAAILIAVPAGLVGGRILCRYLAALLNFEMASFAVPIWVYLLVLVTGIGVPLIAAAFPIIKGSAIRVREAISDYGTGTESFENTYFDWVVSFLGGRFRPLLMVVRNTLRRRKRFLLTVATLVVSGIAFISALNFRASIIRTLDRSFENKRYDLWVSLEGMYPIDMLQAAAHESIGIVRVEAWTVADASFAAPDGSALHPLSGRPSSEGRSDGRFTIIGLPTQTALFRMEILSGRSLRPDDRNAVVVNSSLLSRNPGLSVGQTIALRIGPVLSRWNIVGISREAFSPATAYVSRDRLNEIDGQTGLANSLRLAVESGDINTLWRTRADLDRRLVAVGVVAAGSSTKPDLRYAFDQHMSMIYIFLLVTSGLVATIGGLGLMTSTTLIVIERQREIGVLRVIGATTWMVSLTVIAESILTALVSWIAATVISWPVSKELGNWISITMFQTKLDFQFDPIGPVVWLALSIVIAIIASALPAIRISQFTISRALVAE